MEELFDGNHTSLDLYFPKAATGSFPRNQRRTREETQQVVTVAEEWILGSKDSRFLSQHVQNWPSNRNEPRYWVMTSAIRNNGFEEEGSRQFVLFFILVYSDQRSKILNIRIRNTFITMADLFSHYEQQFGNLSAEITARICKIPNLHGSEFTNSTKKEESLMFLSLSG